MPSPTVLELLQQGFDHHRAGRFSDAEKAYRQALLLDAKNVDAQHLLGVLAQQVGKHATAVEQIRGAIAIDPSQAEFYYNLGNSLLHLKRFDEAVDAFATAVKLSPTLFEAVRNLGSAQMLAGRADEAADSFARAGALQPAAADVLNNLGMAQSALGLVDEAVRSFHRARELQPAYRAAQDNYLYTLHFHPGYDAKAIHREHRAWAIAHADSQTSAMASFSNVRSMDRRVRVGYVSPNFREHPVGRAMLPLIEQSDRDQFITICYSDSAADEKDAIYQRLRRSAGTWRETATWTDAQLIRQIRADAVDILVDITLHMSGNRLSVFAQRAAPVQVTFIGYPATTGLSQIDYRITDQWLDPPGQTEAVNSEELARLPRSFWCYDGDFEEPIAHRPDNGIITFGSLNNPAKISPPTRQAWAKILALVPGSRLMLQGPPRPLGVDPERLAFVPRLPRQDYLRQYQQIDIALDPWPYNGHTTSCDALWMGVPVVSLEGQTSVGRGGVSILSAMGLTELLARSSDEYVQLAVELAGDRDRLKALHASLRDRMRKSPLMDAVGFTWEVEKIYREIWSRWINSAG